jgi:hypothetical protein
MGRDDLGHSEIDGDSGIVERLRGYNPPTCSACDTWGRCGYGEECACTCHHSPHADGADEIERLSAEVADLLDGLRCAHADEGQLRQDEADILATIPLIIEGVRKGMGDEINRLRAQVAEMLPVFVADCLAGVELGPPPDSHPDDECEDCRWYTESVERLGRIEAGEFGEAAALEVNEQLGAASAHVGAPPSMAYAPDDAAGPGAGEHATGGS